MIRSLKTLGLALVAVLALSAVAASAASAAPKLTPEHESDYPVTLKGSQVAGAGNEFKLPGGRTVKCETATFEGTVANKAEAEESKLKATPVFEKCTATILGNLDPATVTMNSCFFILTGTETTSGTIAAEGWEVTGSVHIACSIPGDMVEIHVWPAGTTPPEHATKPVLCTYTIEPQTPGGSLDYKLEEKNAEGYGTSGKIKSTITGVATTRTAGTLTNCGAASQTGELTGEAKVEGFNGKGEMIRGKFED